MKVKIEFKQKVNLSLKYEDDSDCDILTIENAAMPAINDYGFLVVIKKGIGSDPKSKTWWFNLDNISQMQIEE